MATHRNSNYPPLVQAGVSGAEGSCDGPEGIGAGGEARGGNSGSHVGFAQGRPHGAVAVGDLALDNGVAKVALAGVVGRLDLPWPIGEGQERLLGAGERLRSLVVRSHDVGVVMMSSMVRSSAHHLAAIVHGARRLTSRAKPNALFSHGLRRIGRKSSRCWSA